MKLSRKSILVRWAYLPEIILSWKDEDGPEIPRNTDLCNLIFRALFAPPLFFAMFIPLAILFFVFMAPFIWLLEEFPKTRFATRMELKWTSGVIYAAIQDFKNKTCTIIEIVDSEETPPVS